jgi:hypothetical protein
LLQTRVGIATGLVVVGDLIGSGASQEQAIVGETPNLAARLQARSLNRTPSSSPKLHEDSSAIFSSLMTSEPRTSRALQGLCERGLRCDRLQLKAALRLCTPAG